MLQKLKSYQKETTEEVVAEEKPAKNQLLKNCKKTLKINFKTKNLKIKWHTRKELVVQNGRESPLKD